MISLILATYRLPNQVTLFEDSSQRLWNKGVALYAVPQFAGIDPASAWEQPLAVDDVGQERTPASLSF